MAAQQLQVGRREHEVAAIVALMRSRHVATERLATVVEMVGSAVEVARDAAASGSDSARLREQIAAALQDVEHWVAAGVDFRSVLDAEYPANLHEVHNRPPIVFLRGDWREETDWRALAIVGTRECSAEGSARAGKLARELVEAGVTVVSGLARGIDTAAHEGTLAADGRTCAVMGTGLDHIYPAENTELANRIVASGGALLTHLFPHQRPAKWTFPKRNVVMSGLTLGTVVVEAGTTSGARIQAECALEHGRAVFLLASLVSTHHWARDLVEKGLYGNLGVLVNNTGQVIDGIMGLPTGPIALHG